MNRSGGKLIGTDKGMGPDYPYEPWREFEIRGMYCGFSKKDRPPSSWWLTFWERCWKISIEIMRIKDIRYYHPNTPETAEQRILKRAGELSRMCRDMSDITWRPE